MRGRVFKTCLAGLLAGASTAAMAQTAPAGGAKGSEIEEVVVKGQFISKGGASATKLQVPEKDIPQSVSAYTNSFMKAIETREVADLYRYFTGIQRAGNTGYDLTIRGFKTAGTDRNAIMSDGLPGLTVRFGSPPTIGTERIEVVKGPSSILYGQVQPGGFVNIVTKSPQAERDITLRVAAGQGMSDIGNAKSITGSIDATGSLNDSGTIMGRVIAEEGYLNGFRRATHEKPVYLAPSLTWLVDDKTRVTVKAEHRQTETSYDTYLVAPQNDVSLAASPGTRYQADGDRLREWGQTESLFVTHEFTPNLVWNFNFRNVYHRDTALGYDVVAILANNSEVSLRARNQLNIRTYQFGDTNLTADFETGPLRHKVIAGLNLGRETLDANRRQFFNIPTSPSAGTAPVHTGALNILNPVFNASILPLSGYAAVNPTTPANQNDRYTVSDAFGFYLSDLITVTEQWKLMAGVRYSREKSTQSELRLANVAPTSSDNDDVLPVGGVIFQPNQNTSFYASYSQSFVPAPATALDIFGRNSFDPAKANAVEAGVKSDLFDKRLALTAAVFRINRENVISTFSGGTCPISVGTCSQQIGQERSDGFEVEANVTPLPNWQTALGYSHLNAKVIKSTIVQQNGAKLTNVPDDNVHLWTRYDIESGALSGLGAGLGVAYVAKRTGLLPTATVAAVMPLPAYTVVDLGLYYTFRNYELTFKISNLFDKRYFESAGATGQIALLPGAPRAALLSLRAHF